MSRVLLTKLVIKNFGPIQEDEVVFQQFTYFVGRNNAGKSHYIKAVEVFLAAKMPTKEEMALFQNDKTKEIWIEGHFIGVENFTSFASASNHKEAIEKEIKDGVLKVVRILDPNDEEKTDFGILKEDGTIHNPRGFTTNLLGVLPDFISILATADTVDELKNTQNTALKEELMGEFADVLPSVEFELPSEEVIAKEMKIFLDDGYKSEIEQKGHGLQRAALLALLKVLAKHGARYQDKPSPIFLIGELESFLHPFAQKQFAEVLNKLVDQYQIITTTHSPFIVIPKAIGGYRRVRKTDTGTKSMMPNSADVDIDLVKRHLERRGNLEGLFADRIILIEGDHDEGFFDKLLSVFNIALPIKQFTIFIRAGGKQELRQSRKFYSQMNFDDVAIICDLDYLFSNDFKNLLKEVGMDENIPQKLRQHIGWTDSGDPSLKYILEKIADKGEPQNLEQVLTDLAAKRVFAFRKGSPEMYYVNNNGDKNGWVSIQNETDLLESEYLKDLMNKILT